MTKHTPPPEDSDQNAQSVPLLRTMSAHHLAEFIRNLDSKLVDMQLEEYEGNRTLTYIFEVAGKTHTFRLLITADVLESIADLYPAARPYEQALQQQQHLMFR
ncbi:MAG TPA: hypothetical protein VFT66_09255 [Roseiflexaceae bacterium]|nr:hypothetical protein [Roseiflexaceae bacterium]